MLLGDSFNYIIVKAIVPKLSLDYILGAVKAIVCSFRAEYIMG
jgi:hypothetical protein